MLCALAGSAANLFFSLRFPSVFINPVISLIIVHPFGCAWDKLLKRKHDPIETFDHGNLQGGSRQMQMPWKRRLRLWLAQGRWNQKEHACVYVGSNVSFAFAFATDVSLHGRLWIIALLIILGHRGTEEVLLSRLEHHVSAPIDYFHTNPRVRFCRYNASIPGSSAKYDLACNPYGNSDVHHDAWLSE